MGQRKKNGMSLGSKPSAATCVAKQQCRAPMLTE